MDLSSFAERYRLKVRRDEDGTLIVSGRTGQIYQHGENQLAAMFILSRDSKPRRRTWGNLRRRCQAAGMILRQCGDAEGSFSFDPANPEQCRFAIRVAGARQKNRLSQEQRLVLASRADHARQCRAGLKKTDVPAATSDPTDTGEGKAPSGTALPEIDSRALFLLEPVR